MVELGDLPCHVLQPIDDQVSDTVLLLQEAQGDHGPGQGGRCGGNSSHTCGQKVAAGDIFLFAAQVSDPRRYCDRKSPALSIGNHIYSSRALATAFGFLAATLSKALVLDLRAPCGLVPSSGGWRRSRRS